MTLLPCARCSLSCAFVAGLAEHLAIFHLIGSDRALREAREAAVRQEPAAAIPTTTETEAPTMATTHACPHCDFTSTTLGGRNRHVNQQHGGKATRKAPTARPARAAKKRLGGLPSFEATITFLDTQIEAMEERLKKAKAAREGVAMLLESGS